MRLTDERIAEIGEQSAKCFDDIDCEDCLASSGAQYCEILDVQRLLADRAELVAEVERLRAAGRDVLDMLPYHGLLDLPELRATLESE